MEHVEGGFSVPLESVEPATSKRVLKIYHTVIQCILGISHTTIYFKR